MPSKYMKHVHKWDGCQGCELHRTRRQMVFARGTVPCEVLFIGEAPGASEDVLGKPFVGPAGKLLDSIIDESGFNLIPTRYAMTNLVCCVPKDDTGAKSHEPSKVHIYACKDRLEEFIGIASPRIIVMVGSLTQKWIPKMFGYNNAEDYVGIIHPAAILRMDVSQRGLAYQRSVVTLSDILE